jgi:beta-glucosidase
MARYLALPSAVFPSDAVVATFPSNGWPTSTFFGQSVFQESEQLVAAVSASASMRVAFGPREGQRVRRIGHAFGYDGGQAQGEGLVDVIFGDYNPAGRLTTTWYRSLADIPPIDDYDVKKGRTYLYFQGQPLFPFGHGSSYTRFQYSGLSIEAPTPMTAHDTVRVSFDLKNTGLRAGDEVVQLYVRDLQASVRRPLQELKGFRRLRLAPGESRRVSFELKAEDLAFYDVARRGWRVEPGAFELRVGASSADIRLTGGLEILTK